MNKSTRWMKPSYSDAAKSWLDAMETTEKWFRSNLQRCITAHEVKEPEGLPEEQRSTKIDRLPENNLRMSLSPEALNGDPTNRVTGPDHCMDGSETSVKEEITLKSLSSLSKSHGQGGIQGGSHNSDYLPQTHEGRHAHHNPSAIVFFFDNFSGPILASGFSTDDKTSRIAVFTESQLITEKNPPFRCTRPHTKWVFVVQSQRDAYYRVSGIQTTT
ncbi:hypothetical protein TNCV_1021021 [Trichonephila clavipes]|uniref:Uncharacterized protein n=1 Tax=Trichonephila clavipes TaxID=2585209 RepID=A0A8X6SS91_TRICX|nr:hypothetical protein TNCV_1021021 [Trichonephila clavipes]